MKRGTTLFLKAAVVLIGLAVLAGGLAGLPWLASHPANPEYAGLLYPIIAGIYLAAIPFFLALLQAFKLLNCIDGNNAFSQWSVQALRTIKRCAITISAVYSVTLPFIYLLAVKDDSPGLVAIGLVLVFASLVIAVFAAVLQYLLQNAIDIKSENDLTV